MDLDLEEEEALLMGFLTTIIFVLIAIFVWKIRWFSFQFTIVTMVIMMMIVAFCRSCCWF